MTVDLVPPFVRREDFIEQKGSEYCQSIFLTVQKFEVKQFMETIKSLGGFYIYPTDQTGNIRCETARFRCLHLLRLQTKAVPESARDGLRLVPADSGRPSADAARAAVAIQTDLPDTGGTRRQLRPIRRLVLQGLDTARGGRADGAETADADPEVRSVECTS